MNREQALDRVVSAVATICRADRALLHAEMGPKDVKGWDSFGRVQVILELERLVGADLPLEVAFQAQSIAELARIVTRAGA